MVGHGAGNGGELEDVVVFTLEGELVALDD